MHVNMMIGQEKTVNTHNFTHQQGLIVSRWPTEYRSFFRLPREELITVVLGSISDVCKRIAALLSPEVSLFGLQMVTILLCLLLAFPLCTHISGFSVHSDVLVRLG